MENENKNFSEFFQDELILIDNQNFKDDRGGFVIFWSMDNEYTQGHSFMPYQMNQSDNAKFVVRGLHSQTNGREQRKIVWVSQGRVMDVVVNINPNSPQFGKVYKFELSSENKKSLFIGESYLHGFISLEERTIVNYLVDRPFSADYQVSVYPFDEELNIDWGIEMIYANMSERDLNGQSFLNFKQQINKV